MSVTLLRPCGRDAHSCAETCRAPLLQATPKVALTHEEIDALTKRTQDGGTEVVQAKAGKVSCTRQCSPLCPTAKGIDRTYRGIDARHLTVL